jgi:hypothetical protein
MIFMDMKEICVRIRCKKKFSSCAGLIKRSRTNTISKRMALETAKLLSCTQRYLRREHIWLFIYP